MIKQIATKLFYNAPKGAAAILFDVAGGAECRADTTPPFTGYGASVRYLGPVRPSFYKKLDAFASTLAEVLEAPKAIVFANVFRKRTKKEREKNAINRHAQGRAVDIGSVWFPSGRVAAVDFKALDERLVTRFFAVEACLRLHFGTVLNGFYHGPHDNHWHADDGTRPVFRAQDLQARRRKSRTIGLQGMLRYCYMEDPGPIDGKFGSRTSAALDRACCVQPDGLFDDYGLLREDVWHHFLRTGARRAWRCTR